MRASVLGCSGSGAGTSILPAASSTVPCYQLQTTPSSAGVSTSLLSRAVFPQMPRWVTAASIAAVPFQPLSVSFGNTIACEIEYLRRRKESPRMTKQQLRHAAMSLAGLGFFVAEEVLPKTPHIHTGESRAGYLLQRDSLLVVVIRCYVGTRDRALAETMLTAAGAGL